MWQNKRTVNGHLFSSKACDGQGEWVLYCTNKWISQFSAAVEPSPSGPTTTEPNCRLKLKDPRGVVPVNHALFCPSLCLLCVRGVLFWTVLYFHCIQQTVFTLTHDSTLSFQHVIKNLSPVTALSLAIIQCTRLICSFLSLCTE